MGDQPEQRRSSGFMAFWTTLPGVITGSAALISAVLAVLVAVGVIRPNPSPGPTALNPTPAAAVTTRPTAAPARKSSATPSSAPKRADLFIGDLNVRTTAGYPVLDLLLGNRGSIQGQVTRVNFAVADPATCTDDGVAPPVVNYDLLLPKLSGSFSVALPERDRVDPGADTTLELSVGIASLARDVCSISPKITLHYVDSVGTKKDTAAWDEPFTLPVRPLKKQIYFCKLPQCISLSSPDVAQP